MASLSIVASRVRRVMSATLTVACVASAASAADRTWTGSSSVDGEFTTPGNWASSIVPTSSDRAVFNSASASRNVVNLNANRTVSAMLISGRASGALDYKFTLTNSSLLHVTNALTIDQSAGATSPTFQGFNVLAGSTSLGFGTVLTLTNGALLSSPVSMLSNAAMTIDGSSVTGAFSDLSTGTVTLQNSASLTSSAFTLGSANAGTVNVGAGSVLLLTDASTIANGTLTFNSTGGLNMTAGTTFNVTGTHSVLQGTAWALPGGAYLQVQNGGHATFSSYSDVGNAVSGLLLVDGTGSAISAGGTTDWGSGSSGSASVTLSNSATASYTSLRIGQLGGTALVNIASNASLTTNGSLSQANGTVSVIGGNLNTQGSAAFNGNAIVSLSTGAITFNNGATFSAGSQLKWTGGGTLSVPAGQTLTFDAGHAILSGVSGEQAPGSTFSFINGGGLTDDSYFDLANHAGGVNSSLNIAGTGSSVLIGSATSSFTDWGRNVGNVANVVMTNGGTATYRGGLDIDSSGGQSYVTVASGAKLHIDRRFNIGGVTAGTAANITVSNATIESSVGATFNAGTNLALDSNGFMQIAGTLTMNGNAFITIGTVGATASAVAPQALVMANASKINIVNGGLIINYMGPSPINDIRTYIANGYAGGAWTGTNIYSAFAAVDHSKGLAYYDDGSNVVVTLDIAGDFNIDGKVNFDDLLQVAKNYGKPGFWTQGDFNYDGTVGFADLLILAKNYNKTFLASAMTPTQADAIGGDAFAADYQLVQSLVPEPTTMLGGFGLLTTACRRRRAVRR